MTSIALAVFSIATLPVITDYRVMLALVLIHGVFWSGLLSASAAYMTGLLPESRRAGRDRLLGPFDIVGNCRGADSWILDLSGGRMVMARAGATVLNVGMAAIAASLPEHHVVPSSSRPRRRRLIEFGVLASLTLALYCSGMAASPASLRCMPTSTA